MTKKTVTEVRPAPCGITLSREDRILSLGSCFADEIGKRLETDGFDLLRNPFGTMFNPVSVKGCIELLEGRGYFTEEDCVMMGAGAGKYCSWHHYTKFARETKAEFLENANLSLDRAREFWAGCTKVLITYGTAFVWEHHDAGIVANCLKRDAKEFTHRRLSLEECRQHVEETLQLCSGKQVIFTVSPIRHMAQGAHENTISKATLQLAVDAVTDARAEQAAYFPACEIMLDELRDYRYFAEDLVHPNEEAAEVIWRKFRDSVLLK